MQKREPILEPSEPRRDDPELLGEKASIPEERATAVRTGRSASAAGAQTGTRIAPSPRVCGANLARRREGRLAGRP